MTERNFEAALAEVLRHEGGYSDHPADPGGATMMGITLATLSAWRGAAASRADLRALTRAEAGAIYRRRYWVAIRGDRLPSGLDLALFDFAVNSGPSRAARCLQQVLGVRVDGRIGPETLAAARGAGEAHLAATIRALCARRRAFLGQLAGFPTFGRGWERRVAAIEKVALALAASDRPEAPNPAGTTNHPPNTETLMLDLTKTILSSRTIWANAIGFAALILSWLGFDTSGVDRDALAGTVLQVLAGGSFIASTFFRVIATKRLA